MQLCDENFMDTAPVVTREFLQTAPEGLYNLGEREFVKGAYNISTNERHDGYWQKIARVIVDEEMKARLLSPHFCGDIQQREDGAVIWIATANYGRSVLSHA